MSRGRKRRGISLGTIVMLVVTICVSCAFSYMLPRLRGNQPYVLDADQVLNAFALTGLPELSLSDIPIRFSEQNTNAAQPTEMPDASFPVVTTPPAAQDTALSAATSTPTVNATHTPVSSRSFTITFTGSIMLEDSIRKGAWIDEADKYDFSEMLGYITPELRTGDLCIVQLENVIDDQASFTDHITTSQMVSMLTDAGVDAVGAAYPRIADAGVEGVLSTIDALRAKGLTVLGVYPDAQSAEQPLLMLPGSVSVAVLQYTDSLSAGGTKKLNNTNAAYAVDVADAEKIAADVAQARQAGAEIVIVCMNWGEDDSSTPSKAQKSLAQAIADAGADAIIGTGTRAVQPAVWLEGAVHGNKVLCAYSLGALLNEGRTDKNVASYILQLGFTVDSAGKASIEMMNCVPTYTWRYKEDGKYKYFVVPSAEVAPDDMSSAQIESKERALKNVRKLLTDAPFTVPELAE